jgi:fatty-acyl-CoA synthase
MIMSKTKASYRPAQTTEPLRESTVGSTLREAAAAAPQAIGLVARSATTAEFLRWSFTDVLDEAARAARALLGRFEPGERVAVWAPNVAESYFLQLGAALAGLTLVPVPLALRQRDLGHLLRQSGAAGLFLVPEFRGVPMTAILDDVRPGLPSLRETVLLTEWTGFLASGNRREPLPPVDPRAPAQILYTSGSTGLPKGAVLHHLGITNSARFVAGRMGVGPGDVWLNFMPLSYVAGSAIGTMAALSAGATQVLCDFEPSLALSLVQSERCSALIAGATMYLMLLQSPALASTDMSSLRTVAAGGSTIPAELAGRVEQVTGARMTVIYGLTEACGIALSTRFDDDPADRTATIGTALPHVGVKVAAPEPGDALAVGGQGELCLRGYQVMDGYLDLPEATAAAIDSGGWLHTGDLAIMDERGYVRITGRLKEIINRGGRKIAPGEIEALLQSHPAISMAAVVGVPDERWGEEIAAFVKLLPGASAGEEELAGWCRAHLAPYKTPRHWAFVDELPLTSAGKVRKFMLREWFARERAGS